MKIKASSDLLIGQWRIAPKFKAMVQNTIDILQEDVGDTMSQLNKMWDVEQAVGVWLDFLGNRVGITRPLVEDPSNSRRFGWRGPTQAWSFDRAPFRGILEEQRYPLSDTIFRRFVKARGLLVSTRGEFTAFERAVKFIDADARIIDNRDMTILVKTDNQPDVMLADEIGALPRPAGVRMILEDGPVFGFEGFGEGWDRARYE